MIGNVIQDQFLTQNDYPTASALSFILMAAILVARRRLRPAAGHRGAHLGRRLMADCRPDAGPPARDTERAVRPVLEQVPAVRVHRRWRSST